jgi:ribosomal-protein-alanine N-acetyltransferase
MFAYAPSYGKLRDGGDRMNELQTERLLLRPLVASDVNALHVFWNDPAVRRYLWDNKAVSTEQVREVVADSERNFETLGAGYFAVESLSQRGNLIGFCGYRRFEDGQQPELLYGLLPDFWGKGFVTEAARAVLRHGFDSCNIARVIASTDTPNQRSVQVMQRLGMCFEERREYHGLDTVFYALSKEDFLQ